MKIVNVLFNKNLGGVAQAFLDYTESLIQQNHQVITIIHKDSKFINQLKKINTKIYKVNNYLGYWDYPLIFQIRQILKKEKASIAIAHAGRAISLTKKASVNFCPIIGVNHSNNVKRSLKCDAIFVVNSKIKETILKLNPKHKGRVFIIPNMIKPPKIKSSDTKQNDIITIGAAGRLSKEKGLEYLIQAAKILQINKVDFQIIIAGEGEERRSLENLIIKLKLQKHVKLLGWIKNMESFYSKIDTFCLPSLEETFGIVLLHAMLHKKAIVSTNTDGAKDILKNNQDALIVSKQYLSKTHIHLAKALAELIFNKSLRKELSDNAYKKVNDKYTMDKVGKLIHDNIIEILTSESKLF